MVGTGLRFRLCWAALVRALGIWVILVATGMEALNQSEVFRGVLVASASVDKLVLFRAAAHGAALFLTCRACAQACLECCREVTVFPVSVVVAEAEGLFHLEDGGGQREYNPLPAQEDLLHKTLLARQSQSLLSLSLIHI